MCFFFHRYKTLHFNDYVSGAKSCIELIAVYAANQEECMAKKSYLKCFQRFIKYVQNFDQLNIHFEKNEQQVLDKNRPRVIDPVNPFNNLANNWNRKSIELVKHYACETERRLNILESSRLVDLRQLFEPQPVYRSELGEIFVYNPNRSQWLVGSTTSRSLFPDLKIRNERFGSDFKLRLGLEALKLYFQIAICTGGASSGDVEKIKGGASSGDVEKIKEAVQKTINKQVSNVECTWSSAGNEKHEEFDITFTIPIPNQKAVQISYRL